MDRINAKKIGSLEDMPLLSVRFINLYCIVYTSLTLIDKKAHSVKIFNKFRLVTQTDII